ncbi:hypothetical protein ACH5RR_032488 [Cinchona calisaya]|uniref:GUN4-like domain-containing protein n=1 Tax=Cinchona calisaya TaxID=153742 RepID=A0ABD2YJK7_9GENT
MAANYFKSIHHHSLCRRHSIDCPRTTFSSSSFFLKPTTTKITNTPSLSSSHFTTFSLSSTTSSTSTTPSTSQTITFDLLEQHLSSKDFRQADEETRRLLIVLAGEAAQKRGYVFFSEVQFIAEDDLKIIDGLWRKYSENKYGYSVQKKIWNKVSKDFTKFFLKVGWMKKLDTEVEQYNYRSFPTEFIWEMNDETPEGHLPLTNALRGTQLLNSILSHPAFQGDEEEEEGPIIEEKGVESGGLKSSAKPPLSKRVFKPDYSF